MSNEPARPNAVAGIAIVCLCIVSMTAIIGAVKLARPACPPCPACPEVQAEPEPARPMRLEDFGTVIPQREAFFRGPKPTAVFVADQRVFVDPAPKQPTYESKQPGDGLKFLWIDRDTVTSFGLIEIRGHEYVFARGGGVSIIHAASCRCQRKRWLDEGELPPGAKIIIDGEKPPEKDDE